MKTDPRLRNLSANIEEITWDYDAEQRLNRLGLSKPYCERVIRRCIQAEVNYRDTSPTALAVIYRDLSANVKVVFADPRRPVVVWVSKPQPRTQLTGSKKASSKKRGSTAPRTMDELKDRIRRRGFEISNDIHPKVTTKDGRLVSVLAGTASDWRTLKNSWADFQKAAKKIKEGK